MYNLTLIQLATKLVRNQALTEEELAKVRENLVTPHPTAVEAAMYHWAANYLADTLNKHLDDLRMSVGNEVGGRATRAVLPVGPQFDNKETYRTFDEWKAEGYSVKKGSKARGRNKFGTSVFHKDDVEIRQRKWNPSESDYESYSDHKQRAEKNGF